MQFNKITYYDCLHIYDGTIILKTLLTLQIQYELFMKMPKTHLKNIHTINCVMINGPSSSPLPPPKKNNEIQKLCLNSENVSSNEAAIENIVEFPSFA